MYCPTAFPESLSCPSQTSRPASSLQPSVSLLPECRRAEVYRSCHLLLRAKAVHFLGLSSGPYPRESVTLALPFLCSLLQALSSIQGAFRILYLLPKSPHPQPPILGLSPLSSHLAPTPLCQANSYPCLEPKVNVDPPGKAEPANLGPCAPMASPASPLTPFITHFFSLSPAKLCSPRGRDCADVSEHKAWHALGSQGWSEGTNRLGCHLLPSPSWHLASSPSFLPLAGSLTPSCRPPVKTQSWPGLVFLCSSWFSLT